ncbi:MAG TPA: LuxR C-terminal-related transcriptional regulator [Pantanalinema sp.]
MSAPILATKLFAPRRNLKAVPRPDLASRFEAGLSARLTLLSAPAGFGKTSLVAEWLDASARRPHTAWLSLEPDDDAPPRFWRHVLAAFERVAPGAIAPALELMQRPDPPIRDVILTLLNSLGSSPDPLVLVLDDFHAVTGQSLLEGMSLFIENLPPQVHLVLITRADPPFALARMRARGELSELRADDLRFTPQTADAYLNRVMALSLSASDVASLAASTEGWVAGLQLAALSMQGLADRHAFVSRFDGRHRYILDYLVEESLAHQAPDVQEFLLETSILDRFDAALCEAVTTGRHGQAMLARLEQANLFLVPLDEARRWYRYHHLFADMLRHLLALRKPGHAGVLHRRAAAWFAGRAESYDAIQHSLAGEDYDRAADLIEAGHAQFQRGQLARLQGWLAALPDEVLAQRPRLDLIRAQALRSAGQTERLSALVDRIENRLKEDGDSRLLAQAQVLRAYLTRVRRDLSGAIRLSREALAALAPEDAGWRMLGLLNLALAHHFACQTELAVAVYEELTALSRRFGAAYYLIASMSLEAMLFVHTGRLKDAHRLYETVFDYAEAQGLRNTTAMSFALVGFGELMREWSDFERAEQALLEGVGFGEEMLDAALNGYLNLGRLRNSQGDLAEAVAVLERGLALMRQAGVRTFVTQLESTLSMRRALFALTRGAEGRAEALRWAQARAPHEDDYLNWSLQNEGVAVARIHLAAGDSAEASLWLDRVEENAAALSQLPLLLRALVLRALLLDRQGGRDGALAVLDRALALAAPEGFVRVFLDEGDAVAGLLKKHAPRLPSEAARAYALELLSRFGPHGSAKATGRADAVLVEPLSDRELGVLRLIAEGLSNQAIALRLGIELNTVKKHNSNLMSKLGCSNRTQAAARARSLFLV